MENLHVMNLLKVTILGINIFFNFNVTGHNKEQRRQTWHDAVVYKHVGVKRDEWRRRAAHHTKYCNSLSL